jgi:hypothetical protein
VSARDRGRKRGPEESLMDFFIRTRSGADPALDRDVERSCTSKQPYASEAEARAVAAMNGMKLFTYHCRYCDFWHLTRRPTAGNAVVDDEL